jgi:mobilome CxxCx(11)CxxC protein
MSQDERIRQAKVRALQTSIIFGQPLVKRSLKLLTFLGIAVPLLAGGIVTSLYTDSRPPVWILAIAGLIGTFQTIASVWALVDHWDEKVKTADYAAEQADTLRTELDMFHPGPNGTYDEEKLVKLEMRSYGGRLADRLSGIPQRVKDRAKAKAEKRFPPPQSPVLSPSSMHHPAHQHSK